MKWRFLPTAAALAICAGACGRVSLDRPVDVGRDAGGVADAAPVPDAPPPAPDVPPPQPPFATIIRVTNVGAADFRLYGEATMTCPFGFGIHGGPPAGEEGKPLETPDFGCDCDTCVDGRPRCWTADPLCQDPPTVLSPGAHFDFLWRGSVQAWQSPPPAASGCVASCTADVPVPAGSYLFTLGHQPADFAVQSTLPAPGGVVEIAVTAP